MSAVPHEKAPTPTRDRILAAALRLFSASGFDGVSIRDIERSAGVERGLVAYHFGSKQILWNGVVDSIFDPYIDELDALALALRDVTQRERSRALRKAYVRFNARRPEFFRLLVLEGLVRTERTERLEGKLRRSADHYAQILGLDRDLDMDGLIMNFLILGAAAAPFILPAFREPSLGAIGREADTTSPEFLEPYADAIAGLSMRRLRPRGV